MSVVNLLHPYPLLSKSKQPLHCALDLELCLSVAVINHVPLTISVNQVSDAALPLLPNPSLSVPVLELFLWVVVLEVLVVLLEHSVMIN